MLPSMKPQIYTLLIQREELGTDSPVQYLNNRTHGQTSASPQVNLGLLRKFCAKGWAEVQSMAHIVQISHKRALTQALLSAFIMCISGNGL
jgi:hypothetical protein